MQVLADLHAFPVRDFKHFALQQLAVSYVPNQRIHLVCRTRADTGLEDAGAIGQCMLDAENLRLAGAQGFLDVMSGLSANLRRQRVH